MARKYFSDQTGLNRAEISPLGLFTGVSRGSRRGSEQEIDQGFARSYRFQAIGI